MSWCVFSNHKLHYVHRIKCIFTATSKDTFYNWGKKSPKYAFIISLRESSVQSLSYNKHRNCVNVTFKEGKELENKINTNWEIAETYQNPKIRKKKNKPLLWTESKEEDKGYVWYPESLKKRKYRGKE